MARTALILPVFLVLLAGYVHAWAYSGWQYRAPVTVDNTAGTSALTDYQVKVVVDTATLIVAGKMNADCSDIRFADASDVPLSYYLEGPCNDANTVVWVKVPSIPAGGTTTIYMYYGNATAVSESNATAVFDFWDDFDTLDAAVWTAGGTPTVTGGLLYLDTGDSIASVSTFSYNQVFEAKIQETTQDDRTEFRITDSTGTPSYTSVGILEETGRTYAGYHAWNIQDAAVWGTLEQLSAYSINTWYVLSHYLSSAGDIKYCIDYATCSIPRTFSSTTISWYIYILRKSLDATVTGGQTIVDWVRIRQYADPEPTTTLGAEEVAGVGVTVTLAHSPTAQSDLALDPENNITSITVEYNAIISKANVTVTYYRTYDGDTNTTILEGNTDVNYFIFQRTYSAVGDYNTCVYVEAIDDTNAVYTATDCDIVHIDQYPQSLDFDWDVKIPFPSETITFTGSATDNGTLTYSWDFGDSATASGNPATHAYTSDGTYTVTMTVTDDVGLSKSLSKSVPVYSVPEFNFVPPTPHAQEPTTITILHDSRLTVTDTNWTVEDSTTVSESNTSTTVKFLHYGSKSISASFTLTDGTNIRSESLSSTITVDPIHVRVYVKDEETLGSFDVTHTDSNTVKVDLITVDGEYLTQNITTTGGYVEWDLNNFPQRVRASYVTGGVPIIRQLYFRTEEYDINTQVYLPDATTVTVLQMEFYIQDQTGDFTDPVLIIERFSNAETIEVHSAKKDAEGKVVAYLTQSAEYTLSVWQNGVEKSLGTYIPTTSSQVTLRIGGFVVTPSSPVGTCVTFDTRIENNTLYVSVDSCEQISAEIQIYESGTKIYETVLSDIITGESAYAGVDPNKDYLVVVNIYYNGELVNTVKRWVSGSRLVSLGLPDWAYELIAGGTIFAVLLVSGAAFGWFGGLIAILFAALFTFIGWISIPWMIIALLGAIAVMGGGRKE